MKLCVNDEDVKTVFLSEWEKFVPAIIHYCEKSKRKPLLDCAKEIDHAGRYICTNICTINLLI